MGNDAPIVDHIDHLVLTVASIERTLAFYAALGMRAETFGAGRQALVFGNQKINLHELGREFEPKAAAPQPGAIDLCFISKIPVEHVKARLEAAGISVIAGPVRRTGAVGPILSIYCRDPDGNLIEIGNDCPR